MRWGTEKIKSIYSLNPPFPLIPVFYAFTHRHTDMWAYAHMCAHTQIRGDPLSPTKALKLSLGCFSVLPNSIYQYQYGFFSIEI